MRTECTMCLAGVHSQCVGEGCLCNYTDILRRQLHPRPSSQDTGWDLDLAHDEGDPVGTARIAQEMADERYEHEIERIWG